jgi:ribose-phosphate pyrophosphokinase
MFSKEIQLISPRKWDGKRVTSNLNVSQYPDGTPMVKWPEFEYQDWQTLWPETMVLRPQTMEAFLTGMFVADACEERGERIKTLVLPFVPGARQDRLNPVGDFLFTAKSVARMINERKFDQVRVLDPHSNVVSGLIDRSWVYTFERMMSEIRYNREYDGIIAPDAGAGHRVHEFADALEKQPGKRKKFPRIQAHKNRNVETGELSGFTVWVDPGKHYLVVDDICDGGGTFVGLGNEILRQGATADLFVTHGIFSKGTERLNKIYGTITTTDSTLFEKHDSQVINIVDRMIP